MRWFFLHIAFWILLLARPCEALSQEEVQVPEQTPEQVSEQVQESLDPALLFSVQMKIVSFSKEMSSILKDAPTATSDGIGLLEESYAIESKRWETYYNSYISVIAESDTLLTMVGNYQALSQMTADSLVSCKNIVEAKGSFDRAVEFFPNASNDYKKMLDDARKLSLSPKLAPMLEKLKVKEGMLLEKVSQHYNEAKAAADLIPYLADDMEDIETQYVTLMSVSAKIQEMQYKPFLERIKDYIMSIAAVSVVIMFISMAKSKIKAAKDARANAKKFMEQYMNNDDIPSI